MGRQDGWDAIPWFERCCCQASVRSEGNLAKLDKLASCRFWVHHHDHHLSTLISSFRYGYGQFVFWCLTGIQKFRTGNSRHAGSQSIAYHQLALSTKTPYRTAIVWVTCLTTLARPLLSSVGVAQPSGTIWNHLPFDFRTR